MPPCSSTSTGRCASAGASRRPPPRAYSQGKISGFLHLYIGQEAVAVGAISAAEPTDYIVATYREHAHYLARTGDARGGDGRALRQGDRLRRRARRLDAPLRRARSASSAAGRSSAATCRSRRASPSRRKYRGEPDVTLCFFGDGTANMGAFHEGLALAALWKLPGRLHLREQPVRDGHAALPHARRSRTSRCARAAIRWRPRS